MGRKVVYLAGPYRAETEYEVHVHIQEAEHLALQVWQCGGICICPQKNTAYFGGALPDAVWLEGDLELVCRADAVIMASGWQGSSGAVQERALALELGKPIFESIDELRRWISEQT